jgi:roadblock/LC7 domain-containing protein
MAMNLDDLVNMKGVLLAFEFTADGTCTSYKMLLVRWQP